MLSTQKLLLLLIFFVSVLVLCVSVVICLEIFFDFDMPWITMKTNEFTLFGLRISEEKQNGVLMVVGSLLTISVPAISFSASRLRKK